MVIPIPIYIVVFIFGLVFGSFFNVCIHRWPQEEDKDREWVKTPSNCPKCRAPIRWYDNIPLIGWLRLGGKCRDCKAPIHWRYPAVELGNALMWTLSLYLVTTYGLSNVAPENIGIVHIIFVIFLASIWLIGMVTDFEHTVIPDEVWLPNFIAAVIFMFAAAGHTISQGWLSSLYGLLLFAGFIALFWAFGGMGFGDVLVAFGFGVIFGWPLSVVALFLGILSGGIIAIPLLIYIRLIQKRKDRAEMPFGPWLFLGCYVSLFFGTMIKDWYLSTFLPAAPAGSGAGGSAWLHIQDAALAVMQLFS
ncbi:MAG: prepilin peptidase [bacterium]